MRVTQEIPFSLGQMIGTIANVKADVNGFLVTLVSVEVMPQAFCLPAGEPINVLPKLTLSAKLEIQELFRDARDVRDATADWDEGA